MKKMNPVTRQTLAVTIGEIAVVGLTVLGYFLVGLAFPAVVFSYKVITGAALGAAVMILNFALLARATNRAFDAALAERGTAEMTEDEAREFTEKNKLRMQAAMMKSQLFRMIITIAVPVAAFLLPVFDGVASLVPLVAFRPVLMLIGFFGKKADNGQS